MKKAILLLLLIVYSQFIISQNVKNVIEKEIANITITSDRATGYPSGTKVFVKSEQTWYELTATWTSGTAFSTATKTKISNPFTDANQTKLNGIATGAEVNVNADWNASSGDAEILNKPTIRPDHWRGSWNTANIYQAGDVVRHLSEGEERLFMATTAINSGQPAPPAGPALGAWLEIDVKQSRGAWSSGNRYRFGDLVSHNSRYWIANTTISLSQPQPSLTNTDWFLASPPTQEETQDLVGALMTSGTDRAINIEYDDTNNQLNLKVRMSISTQNSNVTLSNTQEYVVFDGTSNVTYTIPAVTSSIVNGTQWVVENSSDSNTVTLDEGSGIRTIGPTTINAGETVLITLLDVLGTDDEGRIIKIVDSGGGVSGITIENQGTPLATLATTLDFTGAAVTASGTGAEKTISIPAIFEDITEYTGNATIPASTQGVIRYTGSAAGTLSLPTGFTSSSKWQAWVVNASDEIVNLDGTVGNSFNRITLPSKQGQFIYWDGTKFAQGPERLSEKTSPTFPPFPVDDLQRNDSWSNNGESSTIPTSGINFSGASNNNWLGFENTTATFDFALGGNFVIDMQTWAIASANEGIGIVNTSSSNSNIFIRPAGAEIIRYDGTNYTFSSPLMLNSSTITDAGFIIIRTTITDTWDAIPVQFGASGNSGSTSETALFSINTNKIQAFNEEGQDLIRGQGVYSLGKDGNISFEKADLASELNGFLLEDTPQNNEGFVLRFGKVNTQDVYDGSTGTATHIGYELSNDTPLYYDADDSRVTTDSDTAANITVGNVVSSEFIYPNNNQNAGLVINTQSEWDNWVTNTQVKNFTTSGVFEIPDIAEGSSEVTAVAGQQFILQVPQGNGTVSLTPRGASTIVSGYPGTNPVYTNAFPLGLTGVLKAEYVLIEVNASANGYLYYEINQRGLETTFLFDWTDYHEKKVGNTLNSLNANITNNTNNIGILQYPLVTAIANSNYTASGTNAKQRHVYSMQSQTQTRSFTIGEYADWGLTGQQTTWFAIENASDTYYVEVRNHFNNGDFQGMTDDVFWLKPKEIRYFTLVRDGGSYRLHPEGPISYNIEANSTTIDFGVNANWTTTSTCPCINIPPANLDRITFLAGGEVEQFFDVNFDWSAAGETGFSEPGIIVNKNGTFIATSKSTALFKLQNYTVHLGTNVAEIDVVENDYLTVGAANLESGKSSGSFVVNHIKYILKEN